MMMHRDIPLIAANDGSTVQQAADRAWVNRAVSNRALIHWRTTGLSPLRTAYLDARSFEPVIAGECHDRAFAVARALPVAALQQISEPTL